MANSTENNNITYNRGQLRNADKITNVDDNILSNNTNTIVII